MKTGDGEKERGRKRREGEGREGKGKRCMVWVRLQVVALRDGDEGERMTDGLTVTNGDM